MVSGLTSDVPVGPPSYSTCFPGFENAITTEEIGTAGFVRLLCFDYLC